MAQYEIRFHGVAYVEADSDEEARQAFLNDEGADSEYTIDSCTEDSE